VHLLLSKIEATVEVDLRDVTLFAQNAGESQPRIRLDDRAWSGRVPLGSIDSDIFL
jgi:hypothetical protein